MAFHEREDWSLGGESSAGVEGSRQMNPGWSNSKAREHRRLFQNVYRAQEAQYAEQDRDARQKARAENLTALRAAEAELEQAAEALRLEPTAERTASYMRVVKRVRKLREQREKLWR